MSSYEPLLESLKSSDISVQLKAIESLRQFPDREVLFALAECAATSEDSVAAEAMDAMKQFSHETIKHAFAPLLVDAKKTVPMPMRCMAAMFLAFAFDDEEAVLLLMMVSERDRDEQVRAAAGKAALQAVAYKAGIK